MSDNAGGDSAIRHRTSALHRPVVLFLVSLLATVCARAHGTTPTDQEIEVAIAKGLQHRGQNQGLVLVDVGRQFSSALSRGIASMHPEYGPATGVSGYSVLLYTPLTWISQKASDAAKEYRTFTRTDVTAEMLAPLLRITVRPNTPSTLTSQSMRQASSVEHVVMRDSSRKKVVQPLRKENFSESVSNAFGATFTYEGVLALFDLGAVEELRTGHEEFFVTIVGSNGDRDFKIKSKHFKALFGTATASRQPVKEPRRRLPQQKEQPAKPKATRETKARLAPLETGQTDNLNRHRAAKTLSDVKVPQHVTEESPERLQPQDEGTSGSKPPGCLGISYTGNVHESHDGVQISGVFPNSAAAEIGLQPGDYITAIDGRFFTKAEDLFQILGQYSAGSKVTVRYRRSRMINDTSVALGSCSDPQMR